MNTSSSLDTIFQGISQRMILDFDFMSSQFKHASSIGTAREYVLKEFLRAHLPQKLTAGSGIVIDSTGNKSKQIDIIIYDTLNTPILHAAESIQIIPIECVYAVIEVKSKLDSVELNKSVENIQSIKKMSKSAFFMPENSQTINTVELYGQKLNYFPVIGLVFAYSSIKAKLLKNKLVEFDDNQSPQNNIDTICILNKAIITNWETNKSQCIVTKEPHSNRIFMTTDRSLLMLYLLTMQVLSQSWMYPINMTDYAHNIQFGKAE